MPREPTTYTFITVYYKHREWDSEEFSDLRKGLVHFLETYLEVYHDRTLEEYLRLDDEELMDEVVRLGIQYKRDEYGHGLVGIVKYPPSVPNSVVYLEIYYKHGEWDLVENHSDYLDAAKDTLEMEMDEEEWGNMTEEEVEDAALERSREDLWDERIEWGVVEAFQGDLIAMGDEYAE